MKTILIILTLFIIGCNNKKINDELNISVGNKWIYPVNNKDPFRANKIFFTNTILAVSNNFVLYEKVYTYNRGKEIRSDSIYYFVLGSKCIYIRSNK